jgi:HK97 family phage major capsid protein
VNPLEEARARLQALTDEVTELAGLETLTDEQDARFKSLVDSEVDQARERVEALEAREAKVAEIKRFAADARNVEAPAETRGGKIKSDPYDLENVRFDSTRARTQELRARAHDAIESAPEYVSDEARSQAAAHLDRDSSGDVAEHYLRTGSPEYVDAWTHYMTTGSFRSSDGEVNRAALSTTAANGGFLIPFHLDPTVILTNTGTVNPFRAVSRVDTITSNVWHGITSAGVTAEWTAEAAEVTDASPTFGQPSVTPVRADAYVQASFEVVRETNVASQIAMLIADAKDNLESSAYATGTGSTQPTGLVTKLQATTASRVAGTSNGNFVIGDIYELVNNLPARHQRTCAWLAHWAMYNKVRSFGAGNTGDGAFWTDLNGDTPPQLLGKPVYESSVMTSSLSTATASNDDILVLGNFSRFLIVDVMGLETVYNPLVIGSNRRPTGEVGWAAFWSTGSDCLDTGAFRLLRV